MSTPPVPPPQWAQRLFAAAKADAAWIGDLVAASRAVADARRVAAQAAADEQAAEQRRVDADAAVEEHAAALRDLLAARGGE
jgi:hypothetical protein